MFKKFAWLSSLTLLLLVIPFARPEPAFACSCAAPPTVQDELDRKTAVFAGKVTEVVRPDKQVLDSAIDLVEVVFEVDRAWKGEPAQRTKVYTALGSESCGYTGFKPGERYLVSAYGSPDKLETGFCEMTKPIEAAAAELTQLGPGREPPPVHGGWASSEWPFVALGLVTFVAVGWLGWRFRRRLG